MAVPAACLRSAAVAAWLAHASVIFAAGPAVAPVHGYEVVNVYPHDRGAFTQGLAFHDGRLYEGTGLRGRSTLRLVALERGTVLRMVRMPARYFGEGIAVAGDRVVQLTWRARKGFVYDRDTFALRGTFAYATEGWGLAFDGTRLVMSDGSDTLRFLDATSYAERGRLRVRDGGRAIDALNELEFVRGEIWANVWTTDRIARIDPESGRVTGWLDLAGLLAPEERSPPVDVLNGIAWDAARDRLFVTGKLWPKLFEIRVLPAH